MAVAEAAIKKPIPFDTKHLDKLMDDAGIDVLVATSKHNVQYMLGGYRFFFFDTMEAAGTTRYLPAIVYQKGKPENAAYVGCTMENFERELGKFWQPTLKLGTTGTKATMSEVVEHIAKLGPVRRIGVELAFLPADGEAVLRRGVSNVELVDAVFPLERLRAKKTPEEIGYLRESSERVVDSMMTTFKKHCVPGATKLEVVEALRREEVNRGLIFDYCLMTVGTSLNRAPSEQRLETGDIISLDFGRQLQRLHRRSLPYGRGRRQGRCRASRICSAWVDEVQQAVRKPIRAGARGGDIADIADRMLDASPHKKYTHFMAHGMGLVTHEAPRLQDHPRMSYEGYDKTRPLEAGYVISIETTMGHPTRGFIKLEDTILVTDSGYEALGDGHRGYNAAGGG